MSPIRPLAVIPARMGSKGITDKNFRLLGGKPLHLHAVDCALSVTVKGYPLRPVISSDAAIGSPYWLQRPADLARDDTPMIDVVRHALEQISGVPEQIIVLLQPTQPLRTPAHIAAAIELLEKSGADSVVSVTPLPLSHGPELVCEIDGLGQLQPYCEGPYGWRYMITHRQRALQTYCRDGTVYAFRRGTVEHYGTIYGESVRPLIIPPGDTCELDTEQDWQTLERRWSERHPET